MCQILPWREDPEAFVAEALFPAVIQRVTQMDAAGTLDERGNARRMSKFVRTSTASTRRRPSARAGSTSSSPPRCAGVSS